MTEKPINTYQVQQRYTKRNCYYVGLLSNLLREIVIAKYR
jgi:hypothetical protein